MNEELQKELLNILRSIKEGSPTAWQALVDQRSDYYIFCGIGNIIFCIFSMILIFLGVKYCLKSAKEPITRDIYGIKRMTELANTYSCFGVIFSVAGAIMFFITAPLTISCFAKGVAPLGEVLDILR